MASDLRPLTALDLRRLEAFLGQERREEGVRGFLFSEGGRALVGGLLFVAALLVLHRRMTPFMLFMVIVFGQGVVQGVLSGLERLLRGGQRRDPVREKAREAIGELRDLCQKGTLPRRMHPAVGHALEACAVEYERVGRVLASPGWQENKQGKHWKDLEQASRNAAGEAMEDAVLLALPAVRRHGQRRAAFASMIKEDPEAPGIVGPLHEIQARLRELAEGLESAVGGPSLPAAGVESALQHLKAIQQAEAELDDVEQRH